MKARSNWGRQVSSSTAIDLYRKELTAITKVRAQFADLPFAERVLFRAYQQLLEQFIALAAEGQNPSLERQGDFSEVRAWLFAGRPRSPTYKPMGRTADERVTFLAAYELRRQGRSRREIVGQLCECHHEHDEACIDRLRKGIREVAKLVERLQLRYGFEAR